MEKERKSVAKADLVVTLSSRKGLHLYRPEVNRNETRKKVLSLVFCCRRRHTQRAPPVARTQRAGRNFEYTSREGKEALKSR